MRKFIFTLLVASLLMPLASFAQNTADYLILNDIGTFRVAQPKYFFKGEPPIGGPRVNQNDSGVLSGTGHFQDHADTTYKVMHIDNSGVKPSPEAEVTQHTGGDSDRWLLHEAEDNYHDDEMETLGLLSDGAVMRKIDNKRVLWLGIGGGTFRWVSNNVVINVSYTDLQGIKSEPIEVVKAYLAKFPSTITMTDAELKASAHNVQWIKDEMERRLWLCDKWNAQYQAGQATQKDLLYNLNRSMTVFINYRQKYYGVSSSADRQALFNYQQSKDVASIQTKLTEYKKWWSANKGKGITLP